MMEKKTKIFLIIAIILLCVGSASMLIIKEPVVNMLGAIFLILGIGLLGIPLFDNKLLSKVNDVTALGFILIVIGLLGIFISMISGLLILLGIILVAVGTTYNPLKEKVDNKDRYCPRCGRSIPFDAVVCPYCKYDFDNTA
jgi:ribosomal protein S27AE